MVPGRDPARSEGQGLGGERPPHLLSLLLLCILEEGDDLLDKFF